MAKKNVKNINTTEASGAHVAEPEAQVVQAAEELERLRTWLREYGISDTETGTRLVSPEVLAQAIGITPRRVRQLGQDGILPKTRVGRGNKYDFDKCVSAYIKYVTAHYKTQEDADSESALKEQKLKAEVALKKAQANLHEIKKDLMSGKYLERTAATSEYAEFFGVFRRFALALPARTVGMLSDKLTPDEARAAEKELGDEVARLLASFVLSIEKGEANGEQW